MDPGHSHLSPVTAPALESEQLSVLFLFLTESLELSKQLTRNFYRDLGRVIQQTDKNDSLGRTLVNFNERNGAHSRHLAPTLERECLGRLLLVRSNMDCIQSSVDPLIVLECLSAPLLASPFDNLCSLIKRIEIQDKV